jgi:cytosine/adenosine deaminase-related metal-dependent hydrolase
MTTTKIAGAAWVAAWDAEAGQHVYLRDVDVAFREDRIIHVGGRFEEPADITVDGSGLFVLPGLIDVHSHPSTEPAARGIREEHGVPEQFMTGLFERLQAFHLDADGQRAGAELAFADLLCSGVTTVVDFMAPYDGWIDLLAQSGLRGYAAPAYASANWGMTAPQQLVYHWDEAAGRRGFEAALAVIETAANHPCGRLDGMFAPGQIDTCTEELLRDSLAEARRQGRRITTHASQSVLEVREIIQRHGVTPVQWAAEIGLVGPDVILAHVIFIDSHSSIHWHTRRDRDLLAETGTTVAHCPLPFARYSEVLEDFGDYRGAGVRLAMGTDTFPHNMLEEMRFAGILGRIAAKNVLALSGADLLHAATIAGAEALGRDDIGRIAVGAKADLVLADITHPAMMPARDPLRSLIYSAAERAVRDVYVDGNQVVANGRAVHLDPVEAAGRLAEAQGRMIAEVPRLDYAGRTADQIAPLSLPRA